MRNFLIIVLWFTAFTGIQAQESVQQKKSIEKGVTYIQSEVVKDSKNYAPTHFIKHIVRKKETLYNISHGYGITVDDINKYNPGLTKLKRGDTIQIPQWKNGAVTGNDGKTVSSGQPPTKITHWVQPGETLYSISQKYGQSVASILEMNPTARDLKTGMRLTIMNGQTLPAKNLEPASGYEYHTIVSGETLFSVSRKYKVSAESLVKLNPSLYNAFKTGTVIRVPGVEQGKEVASEENKPDGIHHVVKKGETLYGLSQAYKVPMSEIVKYNPSLENQPPRVGDTLLIVSSKVKKEENEKKNITPGIPARNPENPDKSHGTCSPGNNYSRDKVNVRVAILIPVFLETNKNLNEDYKPDSIKVETDNPTTDETTDIKQDNTDSGIHFHGNSENFIHFYEGALLAVDSLQQMGIHIELNVFDTEQKPSKVKNLVTSGKLDQMDLIIGPVFPSEQKELSDFAVKNQIPVISPLSASDEATKNNPWFYHVNPDREFIWQKTNEYLITNYRNSNILVLQTSSSESVAEDETAKLKNEMEKYDRTGDRPDIRICNFRKDGYSGLRNAMTKERRNVIVIPSVNEAEVSVVVSNIQALATDFEVTLIGTNRFPQYESINPEQYHYGQLEFLTPYWPDYNQKVTRSFVDNFRDYYKTEPNQFSMQGYDVTFFFIKAVSDFGTDLPKCIRNASAELVQGKYHLTRSASGGFINDGLSVIQYTPDFQVVRKMTLNNESTPENN